MRLRFLTCSGRRNAGLFMLLVLAFLVQPFGGGAVFAAPAGHPGSAPISAGQAEDALEIHAVHHGETAHHDETAKNGQHRTTHGSAPACDHPACCVADTAVFDARLPVYRAFEHHHFDAPAGLTRLELCLVPERPPESL